MALPDTTVVHGFNDDKNPTLQTGIPGSFIQVLKAILVDGWGETPVLSMTYDGAAGLVTATFAEAHGFTYKQVIEITGANEPEYNGRWRIAERPGTHDVKFEIGAVPSGDATGDLYMRAGAAGWTMPWINAEETVAYFKPQPLRGGNYCVRIQDDASIYNPTTYDMYKAGAYIVDGVPTDDNYTSIEDTSSPSIGLASISRGNTDAQKSIGDPVHYAFVANPHNLYIKIRYHDYSAGSFQSTPEVFSGITSFGYVASRRQTPDFMWCLKENDYEPGDENAHGTRFCYGFSHEDKQLSHSKSGSSDPEDVTYLPDIGYMGRYGELQPADGVLRYHYPVKLYLGHEEEDSMALGVFPGVGCLMHPADTLPDNAVFDTEDGSFINLKTVAYPSNGGLNDYPAGALFLLDRPWPTEA